MLAAGAFLYKWNREFEEGHVRVSLAFAPVVAPLLLVVGSGAVIFSLLVALARSTGDEVRTRGEREDPESSTQTAYQPRQPTGGVVDKRGVLILGALIVGFLCLAGLLKHLFG